MAADTWHPGAALVDFIAVARDEYIRQAGRPPEAVYMTDKHLDEIAKYLEEIGMLLPRANLKSKANPMILGMRIVIIRNPAVGP